LIHVNKLANSINQQQVQRIEAVLVPNRQTNDHRWTS